MIDKSLWAVLYHREHVEAFRSRIVGSDLSEKSDRGSDAVKDKTIGGEGHEEEDVTPRKKKSKKGDTTEVNGKCCVCWIGKALLGLRRQILMVFSPVDMRR